ncbi:hypothetical protein CYY_004917 [Polysphondylium violaceum]|uniref:non-specific serine/threonine protein kinase n=1 Tax=Polysphondylium violaceum TaxID=133409 RepID=A0A8J4V010_9MYCE|nr:hypothetical protein CYY_004917 [Polysphondylium violaceum]
MLSNNHTVFSSNFINAAADDRDEGGGITIISSNNNSNKSTPSNGSPTKNIPITPTKGIQFTKTPVKKNNTLVSSSSSIQLCLLNHELKVNGQQQQNEEGDLDHNLHFGNGDNQHNSDNEVSDDEDLESFNSESSDTGISSSGGEGNGEKESNDDFTPILGSSLPSGSIKISNNIDLNSFTVTQMVGKGGFGKVHQVIHNSTKKVYALKTIKKNHIIRKKSVSNTLAEKDILKKIDHPFIVKLHYAFQSEKKLYLVMDFVNGGQLFFHLQREAIFSEAQVRFYIAELVLALEHLHEANIVHRDLKPENILLDSQGHCILTDFGLAKEEVIDDSHNSFCGTLEYQAPEMIQGKSYGKAVDWWSVGILMYDMLIGKPPFECKNRATMQEKIANEKPKFPQFVSSSARSLINSLLHKDPKQRLGSKNGAKDIKSHTFFKSLQWRKLEQKEIPPPFVPTTKGVEDISNFDLLSLKECLRDSVHGSSPNLSASQQKYFDGFSYVRSPLI